MTCQQRMPTPLRHLTLYTPGICRGSCKPDFYCGLFHSPDLDTDLDLRIFRLLEWTHWFWLWVVQFPWYRHIDFDYWSLRLKIGHTAGVTSRQGMLTPWHLILPPVSSGVHVCTNLQICISYRIYQTDHCSLYYYFILMKKRWQFGVIYSHIHKLNIILNLEFWNFNQKTPIGLTSEHWIEMANHSKGCIIQVEKVPFLIFQGKF